MIESSEIEDCHWCQILTFPNQDRFPITITNDIDDSNLPDDFRFIVKSVLHPKVELPEEGFRSGCSCPRPRDCKYAGCHCLQDMDFDEDAFRLAQEEEAKKRIERVKEIKRGLKDWEGWRLDLVENRRGGGEGIGEIFEI